MTHSAQCWWNEGFLGRVIKCSRAQNSESDNNDALFFLSKATQSKMNDSRPLHSIIWLDDSEMEEFFDFVRINDSLEIQN